VPNPSDSQINSIIRFAAAAFGWSWLCWAPCILSAFAVINLSPVLTAVLVTAGACGPALSALRLNHLSSQPVNLLRGWKPRFHPVFLIPALLIMPLIGLIIVLVLSLSGVENPWSYNLFTYAQIPPALTIALLLISAAGQETGWRGFLQPLLQGIWNPLRVSLITGALWGVWQLPLHFVAGTYQSVTPVLHILLQSVALSILFTWLYNKTGGSVLIAALFHFSMALSALIFPVWAGLLAQWAYLLLIVLAIVALGMAVGLYRFRSRGL
jgi:membrane protease YdiL (CAAX protease family)